MARNYARTAQTTNGEPRLAAETHSSSASGLESSSVHDGTDRRDMQARLSREVSGTRPPNGSSLVSSPSPSTEAQAVQTLKKLLAVSSNDGPGMGSRTPYQSLQLDDYEMAKVQYLITDLKTGSGPVRGKRLNDRISDLVKQGAFAVENDQIKVVWEPGEETRKKLIKLDLGAAVTSKEEAIQALGREEARARTEKSKRDSAILKEYYAGGGSPETRARLRPYYSQTAEEKAREQIDTYRAKTGWQEGGRTGYAARVDNAVKTARAVGRTYGAEAAGERLTQGLNTVHNVTAPESTPYTRSTGVKARDTALLERADQGVQRAESTYGNKLEGLGIKHEQVVAILGNGTLGNDLAQAMRIKNAILRHDPQSAVTTDQALDLVTSYNEYARRYNDYEAQKVRYETVYGNRAPVTHVAATPTAEERAGANVNRAAQSQDRLLQRIGLSQESFTARFAGLPPNFYDLERAEQISQLKEILGRERRTPLPERYVGEVLDATVTWHNAYQEYLAVQKRTSSRGASAA